MDSLDSHPTIAVLKTTCYYDLPMKPARHTMTDTKLIDGKGFVDSMQGSSRQIGMLTVSPAWATKWKGGDIVG